jgi:hypothetical protein
MRAGVLEDGEEVPQRREGRAVQANKDVVAGR